MESIKEDRRDGKRYSMQMEIKKKAGVAEHISDKNKDCYKRQGRPLHNDQGIDPR